jgi:hypothetical protein
MTSEAPNDAAARVSESKPTALRLLGLIACAIWILGGTLFFLVRFSSVFYHANKESVDALFSRILR